MIFDPFVVLDFPVKNLGVIFRRAVKKIIFFATIPTLTVSPLKGMYQNQPLFGK